MTVKCECGCGEPAPIAKATNRRRGHVKGQPVRFILGHYSSSHAGARSPRWRGGRIAIQRGYVLSHAPDSPMASKSGYVLEHRLVMADVVGRPLAPHEQVHHVNETTSDNRRENLWLFPSTGSHRHWHESLAAGGELAIPMDAVALGAS